MSTSIRDLCNHLAKYGRNGDSILVHMTPAELKGMELLGGFKSTTNPVTGQPEAFFGFLIPLIASLIGGVGSAAISKKIQGDKPDQTKGEELLAQRGQKAKEEYKIPLIMRGAPAQPPAGYVPGLDGEINPMPVRKPVGWVSPGGQSSLNGPGFASGGMIPEQAQAQQILEAAIAAIQGRGANPQAALQKFIEVFGEDKLQMLMAQLQGGGQPAPMAPDLDQSGMARGGLLKGPGGGMDDLMTARVSDGSKVALSGGEEIIPGDAVAHLGDGSSEQGHRILRSMVHRIRQQKTGTTKQPGKANLAKVLPR